MSEQKLIINPDWEHAQFVSIAELKECEQKLEAANTRIKRLEDIISRASSRFFRDGSNGMVAIGMLNILEEVRKL